MEDLHRPARQAGVTERSDKAGCRKKNGATNGSKTVRLIPHGWHRRQLPRANRRRVFERRDARRERDYCPCVEADRAVATLFALHYPAGMAIGRGCSSAFLRVADTPGLVRQFRANRGLEGDQARRSLTPFPRQVQWDPRERGNAPRTVRRESPRLRRRIVQWRRRRMDCCWVARHCRQSRLINADKPLAVPFIRSVTRR